MNIPHKLPIKFAKEIIEIKEKNAKVLCSFPYLPTLSMLCEAAAQSSASFIDKFEEPKIGFLVSLKNVEQFFNCNDLEYIIKIEKNFEFGLMTEFNFEVTNEDESIYAKGTFTIAIANEEAK